MSVIRWEEPPVTRAGRTPGFRPAQPDSLAHIAEALRERPGEWAVVLEGNDNGAASGMANRIKYGRTSAFEPPGSFDSTTRKVDGLTLVYARYIGEA